MDKKTLIKFAELEVGKSINITVESNVSVALNSVMFTEKLVSEVKVEKVKFDDGDRLFIELFSGHMNLATVVTTNDYVIEVEQRRIWIRQAENYDYSREEVK